MIKCLAIDDEPLALSQLKTMIEKMPFLELVAACSDAFEATKVLDQEKVDAIFVDINMPDLNGLDFVRSLVNPPIVVFITAYSEYALDSYQVSATDYLLKPFGLPEFQKTANKVKHLYQLIEAERTLTNGGNVTTKASNTLFVKTDYKIVPINPDNISYIEAMGEYLRIHSDKGEKSVVTLMPMKTMETSLPGNSFVRIHRSYIINIKKIKEITRMRIRMDEETWLTVSDSYKDSFQKFIKEHCVGIK